MPKFRATLPASVSVVIEARSSQEAIRKLKKCEGRVFPAAIGTQHDFVSAGCVDVGKFVVGVDTLEEV
jgi:hypothetical protein